MIRKATRKDIKNLAEIDIECNDPVDKILGLKKSHIPRSIRERFDNGLEKFFIYYDKEGYKGYITIIEYFPAYASSEIRWLAVKEKYQKQGIGSKLMDFAEKYATKMKKKKIYLYTHISRLKTAVRFYNKIGYKEINTFKKYYSNGDTALLLGKTI